MERIFKGKWLVMYNHLKTNELMLICRELYTYLNINFRHSTIGHYLYMKLLAGFYPEKIITH